MWLEELLGLGERVEVALPAAVHLLEMPWAIKYLGKTCSFGEGLALSLTGSGH